MSRIDEILKFSPEQIKVIGMPTEGAILVKGAAGSGKSTTAMFRVARLCTDSIFGDEKIGIVTYCKSLLKYLGDMLESINHRKGISISPNMLSFINVDKLSFEYATKYFGRKQIADIKAVQSLCSRIWLQTSKSECLNKKTNDFLFEEIKWIKGMMITSKNEYLDVKRAGRKDRLVKADREIVWNCYELYQNEANSRNIWTFEDIVLFAIKYIDSQGDNFVRPYTRLIIDEAQDLSKAKLTMLSRLVDKNSGSIMLLADAAQSIYQKGFSWSQVGISVKGKRSTELTINYRNPESVRLVANALLNADGGDSEYSIGQARPDVINGEKPIVFCLADSISQMRKLKEIINTIRQNSNHSCVILASSNNEVNNIAINLSKDGIRTTLVKPREDTDNLFDTHGIFISTMHGIKGMEFDDVIILNLGKRQYPGFANYIDEEERENNNQQKRKLLYTCMTRARKHLYLLSPEKQCTDYLYCIDKELLDFRS